jgi:hypothetical protein
MAEIVDTEAEPVIDPQTPRKAHRVSNPEDIDKEPDMTYRWERAEDQLDLYYGRIVARNFERVITWHVTGDNMLCHIDSEFAYNYADEQWEETHKFKHFFALTEDGRALEHEPDKMVVEYCQERVERCRDLRFEAFDF